MANKAAASPPPFNFGAKLQELEAITQAIDTDGLDLDDAVTKFERGMELSAQLKQHLQEVENRVETIKARFSSSSSSPTAAAAISAPAYPDDDPFDVPSRFSDPTDQLD